MSRHRAFTIVAAVSLVLCASTACVWYRAVQSYVPEGDRIEQRGREINREVNAAPWASAEYRRSLAKYNAWREVRDDYRRREPRVLADDHLRHVVLPRIVVIALAAAPAAWLLLTWRRWERRWARRAFDPPTRGRRVRRILFTAAAAGSFVLALMTAGAWARSYYVTDAFFWSGFFDEADSTFQRQVALQTGRGSVGVNPLVQSGPRDVYRGEIEASYVRNFGGGLSSIPFHRTFPPRDVNFRFGPEKKKWGFVWSSFQYGWAGLRPHSYAYELIVPYWSVETVLLIVPLLWSWRRLKRRMLIRPGHCRCGYDLTGNTSGVCPECGTNIAEVRRA
jgi:hypothetical protein